MPLRFLMQQTMTIYIALIHKERGSAFGVSFPDFPGCVTAGSTIEEAFAMAKEALAGHIEVMLEEGLEIPDPPADPIAAVSRYARRAAGAPILVPATVDDKAMRVNVTLPARLLRRIDARTTNRSGFLAEAAAAKLEADGDKPAAKKRRA
jgi:predicted RNase H-like HicB family nuclease